jgi:hypothetical protein
MAVLVGLLAGASTPAAAQLTYHGGEVANNPTVYLTFWGKNWNQYPGARTEIREMFTHLSGSGWQGILTQYYDSSGPISPNVGLSSWTDESIAAPNAVNNEHAQDEAEYAMAQRGWPGAGINNIYIVLPAPGSKYTYVEGCGAHHWSSRFNAPYAIVSWAEGETFGGCANYDPSGQKRAFVGTSMAASHEYAEAVVDPHGADTAWGEIADACAGTYGAQLSNGGWVEAIWDNSQAACAFSGPVGSSPTWHYDPLGGATTADPDIASDQPNRLNVFLKGTDGYLWQKWWTGSSWSEWVKISEALGGKIAGGPGAVSMAAGRLDVVARMPDNTVGHWYYDGAWHYDNLGGNTAGDPDIASDTNGHLNVFVKGAEGELWQKWWTGSGWSAWQNLSWFGGGKISGGPGAVSWGPNRFDVVARMPDSSVGHWWYDGSTWHYDNLGGGIINDPDIASDASGHLNVFVEDMSGNLVQKWWTGSGWSAWQNLSWFGGGALGSGPGGVSWDTGRFDVVARMSGGDVGHWWYGP